MRKVNRLLNEGNVESRFVTTIYGVLDSKSRVFTFSNAGHDPGILRRSDGTVVLLGSLGTALGVFPDAEYEERVVGLSQGDLLLFYTDGVTEAFGRDGNMFEIDRLIRALDKHANSSARDILQGIRQEVTSFAGSDVLSDDFTMVAVRVL
jgi:sigma-B regulation protein RsbU (phosphoserine phosphatase)